MRKQSLTVLATLLAAIAIPAPAASYYTVRLDDPKAVYLTKADLPVRGDGVADDSGAIHKAQAATGVCARRKHARISGSGA